MKKFEFQLEKLLSYKGQVLNGELMTLGVLNNQLSEAQHRLFTLQTDQEQCRAEFERKVQERCTTAATCRMYSHYTEYLRNQIKTAQITIESITTQVNKQIDVVKKVKLETRSLETIRTSRYDEYKKEDLKDTERQLEEFVSTEKIMRKSV
ncbi:MAG TPA: flagellar FliJ family protein [Anaerovoracaceae bacterium]|nr:flagellar FliJ family protein [Anaerovoracaceae bacterium]